MADTTNELKEIRFHYQKARHFRVIHVDGAYGGDTPTGNIGLAIYNNRWPIPQQSTHLVGEGGELAEEIKESRIIKDGVIREVEAYLLLSKGTARELMLFLQKHLDKSQ